MRPLLTLIVALLVGAGPWLQGSGWLPCCHDSGAASQPTQTCCQLPVPSDEAACCGSVSAPEEESPSAGCACQHSGPVAVLAATPQFNGDDHQVVARFRIEAVLPPPLLRTAVAEEHARAPPSCARPFDAAVAFVRHRRLLI